jgi:hypothetical protein
MVIVWGFLLLFLMMPLADIAIAGFKFISAHQALRNMGQLTQYSPPTDVTSQTSIDSWTSSLPATVGGYSITAQVYCGSPGTVAPCAADAAPPSPPSPKYYKFSTSFSLTPLSPMVRGLVSASVLCSTCPVSYSEPFQ